MFKPTRREAMGMLGLAVSTGCSGLASEVGHGKPLFTSIGLAGGDDRAALASDTGFDYLVETVEIGRAHV